MNIINCVKVVVQHKWSYIFFKRTVEDIYATNLYYYVSVYNKLSDDTILDILPKTCRNKIYLFPDEVTLGMSCSFLVGNIYCGNVVEVCSNDEIEWKL